MMRAGNEPHVLQRYATAWVDLLREHEIPVRVEVIADAGHLFRPVQWAEIFVRAWAFYGGNIVRASS